MVSTFAGQSTTPAGHAFANTCAGQYIFGGLPNPGDGFTVSSTSDYTCSTNTAASANATSAFSGVSVAGHAFSNSGTASAATGYIKVGASNSMAGAGGFPGGSAYAGWNDDFIITGGNGSAYWIAPLVVSGTLSASGTTALTRLGIAAYKSHNTITGAARTQFVALNGGDVNGGIRNSTIAFGWDNEAAWYGADGASNPSYSVNRTIYFVVPFTYGVTFSAGFYMGGVAGSGSNPGSAGSASFDFAHTATWGGKGTVVDGSNNSTTNFTINSASGFDYSSALVPEPATVGLAGVALAALACLRRKSA